MKNDHNTIWTTDGKQIPCIHTHTQPECNYICALAAVDASGDANGKRPANRADERERRCRAGASGGGGGADSESRKNNSPRQIIWPDEWTTIQERVISMDLMNCQSFMWDTHEHTGTALAHPTHPAYARHTATDLIFPQRNDCFLRHAGYTSLAAACRHHCCYCCHFGVHVAACVICGAKV